MPCLQKILNGYDEPKTLSYANPLSGPIGVDGEQPGGFLLVSTLGSVPDKDEANGAAASGRGIYRALNVITASMAEGNMINSDVLDNFVFARWFLTAEDARRPLELNADLQAAFEIEEISVAPAPENAADFFIDLIYNPVEYANAYTGYIRAFADTALRKQLLEPSATEHFTADQLATEFYERQNNFYQTNPGKYALELWNLTVILRRR